MVKTIVLVIYAVLISIAFSVGVRFLSDIISNRIKMHEERIRFCILSIILGGVSSFGASTYAQICLVAGFDNELFWFVIGGVFVLFVVHSSLVATVKLDNDEEVTE